MWSKTAYKDDSSNDHIEVHQKACIDFRLTVIKKKRPSEFLTVAIAKRQYLTVTNTPFIKITLNHAVLSVFTNKQYVTKYPDQK